MSSVDAHLTSRTALDPEQPEVKVSFEITHDAGEAVIHITGLFDAEAAAKLRSIFMSQSTSPSTQAVIDFTKARDITDIALAALLGVMRDDRLQVRTRGLTARHNRMLRFLSSGNEEVAASHVGAVGASQVPQRE
jgi:anti-anti-sigma regulatory factor